MGAIFSYDAAPIFSDAAIIKARTFARLPSTLE